MVSRYGARRAYSSGGSAASSRLPLGTVPSGSSDIRSLRIEQRGDTVKLWQSPCHARPFSYVFCTKPDIGDIVPSMEAPMPVPAPPFDVVALAASLGGIEALRAVLAPLPADFPAAIVVVQHLSARYPSALAELLDRCTALTVQ